MQRLWFCWILSLLALPVIVFAQPTYPPGFIPTCSPDPPTSLPFNQHCVSSAGTMYAGDSSGNAVLSTVVEADTLQTVYGRGSTIVVAGATVADAVCVGDGVTAADTLVCTYVDVAGVAQIVVCDGGRANCGALRKTIGTINTTPYTLTAADCGGYFTLATGAGEIDLLADMTGCLVCLRETNAVSVVLDPNSTDTWDVVSYNVENGTALAPAAGDSITLAAVAGNAACFMGTASTGIVLLPGTLGVVTDTN